MEQESPKLATHAENVEGGETHTKEVEKASAVQMELEKPLSLETLANAVRILDDQVKALTAENESHKEGLRILSSELLSDFIILVWRTLETDYNPKRGESWKAYLERLSQDKTALGKRDLRVNDIKFIEKRESEIWHRDKRMFTVSKRRTMALIWTEALRPERGHYMRLFRYVSDKNPTFEAGLPYYFFRVPQHPVEK